MMPRNGILLAGVLAVASVTSVARAQVAPAPSAAGAAGAAAGLPPNITIQTAPQPKTIWNCLGISSAGCAAFKQRLCNSQVGQLLNNGMAPLSGLSGGLIPQFCPTSLSPADLDKLKNDPNASPAVKQAEAIKAEEAQAKARVAAVEYLGTVDCRRYPDAKEALIKALRNDNNECVRYAAARVLINGCCCSKKIVAALTITVMGPAAYDPVKQATPDGFPVETSERVRCAATMALQNCLSNPDCIIDDEKRDDLPEPIKEGPREVTPPLTPDPTKPGDKIPVTPVGSLGKAEDVRQAAYHAALARKPITAVVRDAQRVLDLVGTQEPSLMTPGNRTLSTVVAKSRATRPVRITAQAPRIAASNPNLMPPLELTPEPAPRRAAVTPASPAPRTPAFVPTPTSAPSRGNDVQLPQAEDEDDLPPLPPIVPGSAAAPAPPATAPVVPPAVAEAPVSEPAMPVLPAATPRAVAAEPAASVSQPALPVASAAAPRVVPAPAAPAVSQVAMPAASPAAAQSVARATSTIMTPVATPSASSPTFAPEPVATASYKPTTPAQPTAPVKPRKVVRLAPEPTPTTNSLVDRFSRTPESYRGDVQR